LEQFVGGILMDNIASGHVAKDTQQKLQDLGIKHLLWFPALPVLNPNDIIQQQIKHNP
jgi:hypothetical protein